MLELERILVVVDPTAPQQYGLANAARLARAANATLELFICDFSKSGAAAHYLDDATCERARSAIMVRHAERLETLAGPLRAAGARVLTSVSLEDTLHEGILARVRETRPSLVVKDTHHHGLLKRTIITNTDWHLIRGCPAPLLLAKPRDWSGRPRIAGAVDPGHAGDKPALLDHEIIATVEALAGTLAAEAFVVNVFSALVDVIVATCGADVSSGAVSSEVIGTFRADQTKRLADLLASHGVPPDHVELIDGIAAEALPRYVEDRGIDILVMGAIARGRLFNAFVGSTAERVLDRLGCDVLIVKPEALVASLDAGLSGTRAGEARRI